MTEGAQALALQHVFASVGRGRSRKTLLYDVSLDVEPGRTLVLLGASGAGKTTLLRVVAGLHRPDAGEVRIGDRVLDGDDAHVEPEARGVGFVFQGLELWPHRTVAEHVAFGMTPRRAGRAAAKDDRVLAMMDRVGLPHELARRRPATLSGGEQQRVAIARALGGNPAVMCYDEPLASLDPARRQSLRAVLREIRRAEGVTSVYVSHDPDDALELADEVAVMSGGRLLERGDPESLYRQPATHAGALAMGRATLIPATQTGGDVTTALGSWPAGTLPGGDAGTACWRPEDMVVVADPDAAAGTVRDVVHVRDGYVLEVSIDGLRVWARTPDRIGVDETVRLQPARPPVWIPDVNGGQEVAA